jgi:hypothetical protein
MWHPQLAPEYGGEGPIVRGPEIAFAAPDSRWFDEDIELYF